MNNNVSIYHTELSICLWLINKIIVDCNKVVGSICIINIVIDSNKLINEKKNQS